MTGEPRPVGSNPNVTLLRSRNFRDLGGLPTRGLGLCVRPACLFRSSVPSAFEPDQWRALTSLKVRTAIDLRMDAEVAQPLASLFAAEVRVLHHPLFQTARQNWIAPPDQSPKATALRYFEMLQDGLGTVAAVIAHAACPEAMPFLVSCSAGRDRTGIVVACLLDLLDVTDEAIALDYAQSDGFHPQSGRAHAETIHEFLALVRGRYDSIESMLSPLGVTLNIRQTLRRELLAQSP